MMGDLLDKIGEILIDENYFGLAINLFGKSGNPYRAFEVFTPILEKCSANSNLEDYLSFAKFLKSAGMFDTCLQTVYRLGSIFKEESSRKVLGEFLQKIQKESK